MKKNELITVESYEIQHNKILRCVERVGQALYDFATALKEMHDSKAYLAAGYSSFEDYTFRALKIKKSQAYGYLAAVKNFAPTFLVENGNLGITKLQLLSGLDDDLTEEIVKNNDLENMTVKEIKKVVKEYMDCSQDDSEEIVEIIYPEEQEELERLNIARLDSLGNYVRYHRLSRGLSTKSASLLLGISRGHLLNIEVGAKVPSLSLFERLCNVLEMTNEEITMAKILHDKALLSCQRIPADIIALILNNPDYIDKIRKGI